MDTQARRKVSETILGPPSPRGREASGPQHQASSAWAPTQVDDVGTLVDLAPENAAPHIDLIPDLIPDNDVTPLGEAVPQLLMPGTVVRGRYRIERVLGIGGMAAVYLARHVEIGAPLALKVLHESLAAVPTATERFLLEACAVSRIQNPHVVAVSDYGQLDNGLPYMVMEYLQGEDLDSLLEREGPLPWARVRVLALQICEALGAAHREGVIHRDVKPQNCYRQNSRFGDFIKVLDFGIAEVGEDAYRSGTGWKVNLGPLVGTPDYMAPELACRREVDHRADIYSLGVTLFVLLTGRLPFESEDAVTLVKQHQLETPPRPTDVAPGLDPRIDPLLLRALAKKPSDRYPSMAEFAEAIEAIEGIEAPVTGHVSGPVPPLPSSYAPWGLEALYAQWGRLNGSLALGGRDRPRGTKDLGGGLKGGLRWVVPAAVLAGMGAFLLVTSLKPESTSKEKERAVQGAFVAPPPVVAAPPPSTGAEVLASSPILAPTPVVDEPPQPTPSPMVVAPSTGLPPPPSIGHPVSPDEEAMLGDQAPRKPARATTAKRARSKTDPEAAKPRSKANTEMAPKTTKRSFSGPLRNPYEDWDGR